MHQQLVEHLREHSHQDTALKGNGEREREWERVREISGSLLHHIFLLIMTSANLCMFCVSVCLCVCVCDGVMILSCLRFAIENMHIMLERMRRQTRSTRTLTALPTHTLHWSLLTNCIKNGEGWGWMMEHYHNTIRIITLVQLLQHTHTYSIREHQQYITTEGERERERGRERIQPSKRSAKKGAQSLRTGIRAMSAVWWGN